MQRPFRTFIGVDLGGGKGKTTAVARLRLAEGGVVVDDYGGDKPWYDDRLIEYLRQHAASAGGAGETVVAIDAPLTLTACVRCTLPSCPTINRCEVPAVRWMRQRQIGRLGSTNGPAGASTNGNDKPGGKPRYTPYTQRATEVVLHEDFGILPRETLGQGMGPLTARAAHLRRALADKYTLNQDLLEVYPKATLAQLFPDRVGDRPGGDSVAASAGLSSSSSSSLGRARSPGVIYKDANGQQQFVHLHLQEERRGPQFSAGVLDPNGSHGTNGSNGARHHGPSNVLPFAPPRLSPATGAPTAAPAVPLTGQPRLLQSQVARHYKRSGHATPVREQILRNLPGLSFGPGQWQEFALQNDHQLDAILCAYTAYLWARDGWEMPSDPVFQDDGWIWFPPR